MKSDDALLPTSRIESNKRSAACDLEGEMVILNLDSGIYFGLNPVGASIWRYIESRRSLHEVIDYLMAEYSVSRERCQTEVIALLNNMAVHGLIDIYTDEGIVQTC